MIDSRIELVKTPMLPTFPRQTRSYNAYPGSPPGRRVWVAGQGNSDRVPLLCVRLLAPRWSQWRTAGKG